MSKGYVPVACGFYDALEEAATLHEKVEIRYIKEDESKIVISTIKNFETKDGEEFAILADDMKIRLDYIKDFKKL